LENKSKAETFIGFSIRARKFRIGMNAINTLKRVELIIVCKTASENSKLEADKMGKRFHCRVIQTMDKSLEQITLRENAKVMAITDKALSKAILDNSKEDFIARN